MNVSIEPIKNDNSEDHSLETLRVTLNLNQREVARMDDLRGDKPVAQYIREALGFERADEFVEEIHNQQRESATFAAEYPKATDVG